VNSEDKRLGMDRDISRRDFLEGSLQFAGGIAVTGMLSSQSSASNAIGMKGKPFSSAYYPPSQGGLRGSHRGSFEVAHQLSWDGKNDWSEATSTDSTDYDLIVVGSGISGLSAAYFYLEQHPHAKILILDNHDDFGGHAKRNEFAFNDRTIIGYGGSQSLEAPSAYSGTAKSLLKKIGVEMDQLADAYDQDFYRKHDLGSAIYFDKESYGQDVTLRSEFFDASLFMPLAESSIGAIEAIASMPISDPAKAELRRLLTMDTDKLPDHSMFGEPAFLETLTYQDFITKFLGVQEPEVIKLLKNLGNSYFGHGMDMVPAMYALGFGMPGLGGTSLGTFEGLIRSAISLTTEPYIYHFPDGNASVARLLVRGIIPGVTEAATMQDMVTASFNYSMLDREDSPVRLRLNSTVVNVAHDGNPKSAKKVNVTYMRNGLAETVQGKQVVMACYNMAIPHICPELPPAQKEALAKLVKIPMCSTNVLLNNWHAMEKLGIGMVYSPERWNKTIMMEFPVSMGEYQFAQSPNDPVMLHCLRGVTGTGDTPEEQSRAGRYELLGMPFDAYEREFRAHLAGMLGSAGFDPSRDIEAITVNRWPHGYAWNPNPLFNGQYAPGEAPHEIGRKRYGSIAIANSDSGARAYLDCAIDEAWRAVGELS
jgi:spermidine dehydrogenase